MLEPMKADHHHHAHPMEGMWLGFLLCVPLWTAVLIFALR